MGGSWRPGKHVIALDSDIGHKTMSPVLTRTPAEAFLNHWVQEHPSKPSGQGSPRSFVFPVSDSTPFYCCPGI